MAILGWILAVHFLGAWVITLMEYADFGSNNSGCHIDSSTSLVELLALFFWEVTLLLVLLLQLLIKYLEWAQPKLSKEKCGGKLKPGKAASPHRRWHECEKCGWEIHVNSTDNIDDYRCEAPANWLQVRDFKASFFGRLLDRLS